jgi:hypothetical protein
VTKLLDAISDYANAPEEANLDPPTKKKSAKHRTETFGYRFF